jgi:hypothetical protein
MEKGVVMIFPLSPRRLYRELQGDRSSWLRTEGVLMSRNSLSFSSSSLPSGPVVRKPVTLPDIFEILFVFSIGGKKGFVTGIIIYSAK